MFWRHSWLSVIVGDSTRTKWDHPRSIDWPTVIQEIQRSAIHTNQNNLDDHAERIAPRSPSKRTRRVVTCKSFIIHDWRSCPPQCHGPKHYELSASTKRERTTPHQPHAFKAPYCGKMTGEDGGVRERESATRAESEESHTMSADRIVGTYRRPLSP